MRCLITVFLIGIVLYVHGESSTKIKTVNEYHLKASYLTLFPQYTSWPEGTLMASNSPLLICVLGRNPFGSVLEQSALSRKGRVALSVKRIKTLDEVNPCQIVFIAKTERRNEAAWLAALKDKPILTVGESGQAIAHGCAVEFKTEHKRVRFVVNLAAVAAANLKISSAMLTHASKVYRNPKEMP